MQTWHQAATSDQANWLGDVSLPVGCYHLHPPLPFIIITLHWCWYIFVIPRRVKGWISVAAVNVVPSGWENLVLLTNVLSMIIKYMYSEVSDGVGLWLFSRCQMPLMFLGIGVVLRPHHHADILLILLPAMLRCMMSELCDGNLSIADVSWQLLFVHSQCDARQLDCF